MIVCDDILRSDARNQIYACIESREIVVVGGFRGVPAPCGWHRFGIGEEPARRNFPAPSAPNPVKKGLDVAFFRNVLRFGPEKSGADRAKQPFVSSADHEVHAELIHVERNRTAALADIEQKQSALRVAGCSEAGGIQHHAVIETNKADGDGGAFSE